MSVRIAIAVAKAAHPQPRPAPGRVVDEGYRLEGRYNFDVTP